MEEIYDWLSDVEKQVDFIVVNNDDIVVVKEEYGRYRVLKIFVFYEVLIKINGIV